MAFTHTPRGTHSQMLSRAPWLQSVFRLEGRTSTKLSLNKAQDQHQPHPANVKKSSLLCEEGWDIGSREGSLRGGIPHNLLKRSGGGVHLHVAQGWSWRPLSGNQSASLASCAPDWMHPEVIPSLGPLCEATSEWHRVLHVILWSGFSTTTSPQTWARAPNPQDGPSSNLRQPSDKLNPGNKQKSKT